MLLLLLKVLFALVLVFADSVNNPDLETFAFLLDALQQKQQQNIFLQRGKLKLLTKLRCAVFYFSCVFSVCCFFFFESTFSSTCRVARIHIFFSCHFFKFSFSSAFALAFAFAFI